MDILLKTITCEEFDVYESSIDTEYFGISSAKAILKQPCAAEQRQNELIDFLQGFEFIMISNKACDPVNNRWLGEKTSAFLVDINIQLRKELSTIQTFDDYSMSGHITTISDNLPENNQIVQIAETYFKYSQFLNDPYLPKEKARCIYGDIVKNAFGKPGRLFVITKIADVIAGFLLFSINGTASTSTINLIAVNQDFKGQRIGQALVRSMENFVFSQGVQAVYVGTQFNNFGALKFYARNGFTQYESSSTYHYWPMKSKIFFASI